ncbi:MAG: helix-turn-helix transcriptional regulator [Ruminococcus sp.]
MVFGDFIRQKRKTQRLSVRALAEIIGISPVYQSSIETGKRSAPSYEVLKRMEKEFALTSEESALFFDLASESCSEKTVPMDIVEYINDNAQIRSLIRAARDGRVSDADIVKLLTKAEKARKRRKNTAK